MAGTSTNTQSTGTSQTIAVGLWGGPGGSAWDDGSYTGIREINLSRGDAIGAFSVIYDLNGQPFTGPTHPGNEPTFKTVKITLDFPNEFLVSVSGYTGVLPRLATGKDVIRSLTFKTNKKTYGPYGTEEGTPFSLPIENGLIVGFKGRSGYVVDAIGFHLSL
uniref:Mannose-binding lectin n=1 Tax=Morus alba var. multicaulis TaxID=170012 RepID=A0A343FMQ1_MORAL|nr:mannose-binding lectin [Morus alba var. multicaulis]